MTRKALSKKWKIIICCIALIVAMAGTGVTVWAIARNYFRYTAGFEVNITGGRDVYASVTGSSYVNGSNTASQTLNAVTFNNESASITETTSFNAISMENNEQVSKFRFAITNNSPYSNHNDLIVKASTGLDDVDDVIVTWYYSTNNTDYDVYTGEYLVAHKNGTIYLELRMLATHDMFGAVQLKDSVNIDLNSEINMPTDFEWEYDYSVVDFSRTKKCPTCNASLGIETINPDDVIMLDSSYCDEHGNVYYTTDISDKYVFIDEPFSTEIYFDGILDNVVIVGRGLNLTGARLNIANSNNTNVTLTGITFNGNGVGPNVINARYSNNIKIIGCTFINCYEICDFLGVSNLLIKNCVVDYDLYQSYAIYDFQEVVNLKIIKVTCSSTGFEFKFSNVANLVYSNNGIATSPTFLNVSGDIYIVNNASHSALDIGSVNNANIKIENNEYYESDQVYVFIDSSTDTTIEVTNNYNCTNEKYTTTHKVKNLQTNIELGFVI